MAYLRLLLLPFSLLYGLVIWARNRCYDWGWLKSTAFDRPVIVVGNLAVGGTGKSPMTEYLIGLLADRYRVATLSRGYGRKTSGFLEVGVDGTAVSCGDEPLQFKRKFPHITVAVDEDRVHGVATLIQRGHEVILLDDAYQHRSLSPGLSILLFDFGAMGKPRLLLPAGDYRDSFRERRRADVIVVTKTPLAATATDKDNIIRQLIMDRDHVPVLFSSIGYGDVRPLTPRGNNQPLELDENCSVLLLTGIANPYPLVDFLTSRVRDIVALHYPDHHRFMPADIRKVVSAFDGIVNPMKLIITTEKDAQRLLDPALLGLLGGLPVWVLPIRVTFDREDEGVLRQAVLSYCSGKLGV